MIRAAAARERRHNSETGSRRRGRKAQLVGFVHGGTKLGNDSRGFGDQVCSLLGLSERKRFRREDHGIVMVTSAAVTFCQTQSRIDGSGCSLDDLSEQFLALIRISAQQGWQSDKKGAFSRERVQVLGSQFESAIQLLHHAAKAHDGGEVHLAIDSHQFAKITEEGEMSAG